MLNARCLQLIYKMPLRKELQQCMDKRSCMGKIAAAPPHSPNITSTVRYPPGVVVCAERSKLTAFAVPQALLSHRPSVAVKVLKLLRLQTPPHEFAPPNAKFPLLVLETQLHSPVPAQLLPTQEITLSLQTQLPTSSLEPTSPVCDFLTLPLTVVQRADRVWITLCKSIGTFMTNAALFPFLNGHSVQNKPPDVPQTASPTTLHGNYSPTWCTAWEGILEKPELLRPKLKSSRSAHGHRHLTKAVPVCDLLQTRHWFYWF